MIDFLLRSDDRYCSRCKFSTTSLTSNGRLTVPRLRSYFLGNIWHVPDLGTVPKSAKASVADVALTETKVTIVRRELLPNGEMSVTFWTSEILEKRIVHSIVLKARDLKLTLFVRRRAGKKLLPSLFQSSRLLWGVAGGLIRCIAYSGVLVNGNYELQKQSTGREFRRY